MAARALPSMMGIRGMEGGSSIANPASLEKEDDAECVTITTS